VPCDDGLAHLRKCGALILRAPTAEPYLSKVGIT
jgi:hypothetical protein